MRAGDRARWWVLLGCLVCQMGLGLGGYVFAVFLKPVVAEMGWSRTAFAAAGGPLLLAMALASPLVGALVERVGARAVFASAITLVAAALLGLSVMQSLWSFYALGFLLGVAITGLGDIPAGGVVSAWFGRRRGLALGLVFVGSNLGGALVPLVAAEVAASAGWRVALRVLAVGGWLLIIPFALWAVRERPADAQAAPEIPPDTLGGATLAEAVRTPAFWILAGVLFTFYFYYLGVNHHLVAFLTDVGFSDAAAARRFAWAIAVGIAGKIGVGLVADRIPVHRAALLTFGLLTLGSFALLAVGEVPRLLPLFLTVHGLTVAAENVMLPLLVAWCFGAQHLTRIYGTLMLALLPGGFLGAVFAAWVQDRTGRYLPAFVVFAVLNACALGALARLRGAAARSGG
ncbi:MAG: MFS transporter [bacterium]|nr:MFS transporter [bacterium]